MLSFTGGLRYTTSPPRKKQFTGTWTKWKIPMLGVRSCQYSSEKVHGAVPTYWYLWALYSPYLCGLCDVLWPQGMCLCDVMHSMVYIAHMSLCIMQQAGAIGLSQSLGLQPWNPSDLVVLQCDAPHSWTTMLPSITHNIHACMGLAYFTYLFTMKYQPFILVMFFHSHENP